MWGISMIFWHYLLHLPPNEVRSATEGPSRVHLWRMLYNPCSSHYSIYNSLYYFYIFPQFSGIIPSFFCRIADACHILIFFLGDSLELASHVPNSLGDSASATSGGSPLINFMAQRKKQFHLDWFTGKLKP